MQAATDIMLMLLNPPKSTIPAMQAGDLVHNVICNIIKLLKRVDKILHLQDIEKFLLPRVQNNESNIKDTPLLRVQAKNSKDTHIILFDYDKATPKIQKDKPLVTMQALTPALLLKKYQMS